MKDPSTKLQDAGLTQALRHAAPRAEPAAIRTTMGIHFEMVRRDVEPGTLAWLAAVAEAITRVRRHTVCLVCGSRLLGRRSDARTCGDRCRQRLSRSRRRHG